MREENLVNFIYGLAQNASLEARDLAPGEVIESSGYGDEKRDIDQIAEEAIVNYLEENATGEKHNIALKPEDASWGENSWLTGSGEELSGEKLIEEDIDYALIVDQVEGTKNFDNRDRYTSIAAIDPENPTLEGIEAAVVYRWDDTVYFSDGEDAYETSDSIEDSEVLKARAVDEVDNTTKIRGQMIGLNAHDYAEFIESMVNHYSIEESRWPSLKGDGTTTGDIIGTVTDKSIAIDIRSSRDMERLPFAQDFAPAAKIAQDAGVEIINEDGEPVDTDFTEPGSATSYIALPPGDLKEEIKKDILPEII